MYFQKIPYIHFAKVALYRHHGVTYRLQYRNKRVKMCTKKDCFKIIAQRNVLYKIRKVQISSVEK